MNIRIFPLILLLSILFATSKQQGRRPPPVSAQSQSTQQNAGNRRGGQPSATPSLSRGGPQSPPSSIDDEDEELDSDGNKNFVCPKADGLFSDPNSCRKFMLCGSWRPWSQTCPPSLYFDGKLKFCTFKTPQLICGDVSEEETKREEQERNQDKLPTCDPNQCQLPNCFCSEEGTSIPGNLAPNETPQFVLINFSGALNELVFEHYKKVMGYSSKFSSNQNRHNPNGCGIRATFFLNHEYTNYAQIQWLAAQGHEIAMHSITHRLPEVWWTDTANYSDWAEEMIGIREIILANSGGSSSNSAITREKLIGMRAPYFKPGGDAMFEMASDFGLLYDSSVVAPRGTPPYWPFTWDYRQPFDCSNNKKETEEKKAVDGEDILGSRSQSRGRQKRSTKEEMSKNRKKLSIGEYKKSFEKIQKTPKQRVRRNSPFLGRPLKCATKPYPGLWEIPINPLWNEYNTCHHADQCVFPHATDDDDIEDIVNFLKDNFERHYGTNRAPFQLNFHVTWFTQKGHIKALNRFMDYLLTLKDVWFVTYQQLVEWMREPKRLSELNYKCENATATTCTRPHTCVVKHYLASDGYTAASEDNFSKSDTRYMPVCHSSICPQQFQWFGNHAGKKHNYKTIMQLVDDAVSTDNTN
ncbi:chitin deacetylase 1-like [Oppia nitens]|uniref:chitin deacetylase 1-like n=1 Tax=Oppia nitens TaxID=1686743 RepID=UPI0023DC18D7|nr:chitin deacetylase 1-like [Oppia nitens]